MFPMTEWKLTSKISLVIRFDFLLRIASKDSVGSSGVNNTTALSNNGFHKIRLLDKKTEYDQLECQNK